MSPAADGLLLLIGSGWQPYREYLLAGFARRSPVWLIDEQPVTWQARYLAGSTVVEVLDTERVVADRSRLVAAALAVAAETKVIGVLTYDELLVTTAADVAERLGLPGLSVAGAEGCRDKARTRAALTAAGLPQPAFALVHDFAAAQAAATGIGFPVVAKPRGMGASVGVVQALAADELAAAFAVAERARHVGPLLYEDGVLIEELVHGPEISVDAAVVAGEYRPFCLARKQLGPAPCFEEVGHLVDPDDELLADPELLRVLAEAHRALGVLDGLTHTEVRLTDRGPVVIEVNARLGGDLIPYLGSLATGIDPTRVAAEVATGTRPDLTPAHRRCVGIAFLYPPVDCRVLRARVPDPAAVPGLLEATVIAAPGTELRLPPNANLSRYGYLIATAPSRADCAALLARASELAALDYEPLEQTAATGSMW